ncbi:hypothetical protein [Kitasatospora sp. NPDC087315]|uniref:hypothetical protein n=1 Tax=Kitasatospora sp. NPDC087315 TaxID=3364069 RepID=UPI0037F8DB2A
MKYIEAPQNFHPDGRPSVYLAGQSMGCPDWQAEAVNLFATAGFTGTVLSPRPSRNPRFDPFWAWRPNGWQDQTIGRCDIAMFWRPLGLDRVQDLYELHLFGRSKTTVVVGCDPRDPVQATARAAIHARMPWLPVEPTLGETVRAALTHLGALATTRP